MSLLYDHGVSIDDDGAHHLVSNHSESGLIVVLFVGLSGLGAR